MLLSNSRGLPAPASIACVKPDPGDQVRCVESVPSPPSPPPVASQKHGCAMQERIAVLEQQLRENAQAAVSGATQHNAALALARSKQAEVCLLSMCTIRCCLPPSIPALPCVTLQLYPRTSRAVQCMARSSLYLPGISLCCLLTVCAIALSHGRCDGGAWQQSASSDFSRLSFLLHFCPEPFVSVCRQRAQPGIWPPLQQQPSRRVPLLRRPCRSRKTSMRTRSPAWPQRSSR